MRPYGAVPTEEDELEKALNRVPDEVSVEAAPFIQEGSLLAAGGGEPSELEGDPVLGSKQSPADAAKFAADHTPPPQADTREAMLRKVFDAQQKHDEEKSRRMAKGARLDRKRQNEDDLRAILTSIGMRGREPQFRNLGNSYSQEAASVGNDGPLSRELALQKVLAGYKTEKPVDPLDEEKKRALLRVYDAQAAMYGRANQPKPLIEKPEDPLLEEKRAKLQAEIDKLRRPPVAPAPKPDKTGAKRNAATIYYGDEEFYVPDDREPPNESAANALKTRAANGAAIADATRDLEAAFARLKPGKPGDTARAEIRAIQGILMPAINVYLGQGAMAEAEEARMREAIGDPNSIITMIQAAAEGREAPENVKARLAATRKFFDNTTRTFAKTWGYKQRGGAAKSPAEAVQTDNEGKKWRELPDGSFEEVL